MQGNINLFYIELELSISYTNTFPILIKLTIYHNWVNQNQMKPVVVVSFFSENNDRRNWIAVSCDVHIRIRVKIHGLLFQFAPVARHDMQQRAQGSEKQRIHKCKSAYRLGQTNKFLCLTSDLFSKLRRV